MKKAGALMMAFAGSLATAALLLIIGAYQRVVSPVLHAAFGPRCRFHPTCSEYARLAIREHGVLRGGWLGLRRLGHCHPFHPGGVDLVPARVPTPSPLPDRGGIALRAESRHG